MRSMMQSYYYYYATRFVGRYFAMPKRYRP